MLLRQNIEKFLLGRKNFITKQQQLRKIYIEDIKERDAKRIKILSVSKKVL